MFFYSQKGYSRDSSVWGGGKYYISGVPGQVPSYVSQVAPAEGKQRQEERGENWKAVKLVAPQPVEVVFVNRFTENVFCLGFTLKVLNVVFLCPPVLSSCAQRVASWKQNKVFWSAHCSPLMAASTSARPQRKTSNTQLLNCSLWSSPAALSTTCWWRREAQPSLHSSPVPGLQALASIRTFWPSLASQRWAWSTSTARITGSLEIAASGTTKAKA